MKPVDSSKMSSLRRANCIEELESRIVFDGAIDVEPHQCRFSGVGCYR